MAKKEQGGWDDPENEVQSNWMKFNIPLEDKIHGTLIAKRQVASQMQGKEGQKQWQYDIKTDEATVYHKLDEAMKLVDEPIHISPGEVYSVGGTVVIDRQMQNIKIGQIVGLKFIEEVPAKIKGHHPAKIVKVYAPKGEDGSPLMDDEFLQQRAVDEYDATA